MRRSPTTIVALSGGVDSAVAACLMQDRGHRVECLHMTNWEDDDGYCTAATDLQDARAVCKHLGLTLHQVNFSREYREQVFTDFLAELRAGRSPNPDILCNREIKFGVMRDYARRLGADTLVTGHYARVERTGAQPELHRAADSAKDQSYFLSAVASDDLVDVEFPLGNLSKSEVREIALRAGLTVASKRDSTGICFIGERPFGDFLARWLQPQPGRIVSLDGTILGQHQGLHRYTLGQRKGLGIGGVEQQPESAWYVAQKRTQSNELLVVQGHDHPALFANWLETGAVHWIGAAPAAQPLQALRCTVKTRYRQVDQHCELVLRHDSTARVRFQLPQRAITPGQYAVFYSADRCLGSARIERTEEFALSASGSAEAC